MSETIKVKAPAAPGNAATITLFDSTAMVTGTAGGNRNWLSLNNINRVRVAFANLSHASAANGLKAQYSHDGGTTWLDGEASGQTVAVAAYVQTFDFACEAMSDMRLRYENGATQPTTWQVEIDCISGDRALAS